MTLHVRFEYHICMPSFISVNWLVYAVRLLTLKKKKKKKMMMMMMIMMMMKRPVPSLYTKQ